MAADPKEVATNIAAPSLLARIASRYSVDPKKLMTTLKATCFKVSNGEATDEQMMALLIVADQYKLNPFTKEIFAFPDKGGIVPVVSVDGWDRIINEHPSFDGVEFIDGPDAQDGKPTWIECVIHRKDRQHPTRVKERFVECRRDTQPWKSHPWRMLRHKALIQCARIGFGFAGIYDQDEAERIVNVTAEAEVVSREPLVQRKSERVSMLSGAADPETIVTNTAALPDGMPGDITAASLIARLAEVKDRDAYDEVQSLAYDVLKGDELKDYKRAAAVKFAEIAQDV